MRQRGIILITTLLLVICLMMLGITLITTGRNSFIFGASYYQREVALQAAQSGVDYAMAMLEANRTWGSNGEEINYDLGDERRFYISFRDGSDVKYASINNLMNTDSITKGSTVTNTDDSVATAFRNIPSQCSDIIVKGMYQKAESYLEIMYAYAGPAQLDSVAFSNNQMRINLVDGGFWDISSATSTPTNIRSNMYPGVLDSIVCDSSGNFGVNLNGGKALSPGNINLPEDNGGKIVTGTAALSIPDIQMSLVKSNVINTTMHDLDAGLYMFTGPNTISYYPVNPGDSLEGIVPIIYQNTVTNHGVAIENWKLNITQPQQIRSASSPNGSQVNTIQIQADPAYSDNMVKLQFTEATESTKPMILNDTGGNILVKGEAGGEGSLFSQGNIEIEGQSIFNPKVMDLALYAEGDINIDYSSRNAGIAPQDSDELLTSETMGEYLGVSGTGEVVERTGRNIRGHQIYRHWGYHSYDSYHDNDDTSEPVSVYTFAGFLRNVKNYRGTTFGNLLQNAGGYSNRDKMNLVKEYFQYKDSNGMNPFKAIWGEKKSAKAFIQAALTSQLQNAAQSGAATNLTPKDTFLSGLVYTKGDFNVNLSGNSLFLSGALLVNGSDPKGKLTVNQGKVVSFIYDPERLEILEKLYYGCKVKKVLWNNAL